jgi:hypothetical protein
VRWTLFGSAPTPIKAATAKVTAAWRNAEGVEPFAVMITGIDVAKGPELDVTRDMKHKPRNADDNKDEVDPETIHGRVVNVESETGGVLQFVGDTFSDKMRIETTETYHYEIKSAGARRR